MKSSKLLILLLVISSCISNKVLEVDEFPQDNYTLIAKSIEKKENKYWVTLVINGYSQVLMVTSDSTIKVGDTIRP